MRIKVTREETVERRWDCPRCAAHGVVHLRAHGHSGWRQVWWSRDAAEDDAAEDARWDVQHDAERMMAMIRCPMCHERAPRVVLWSALRTVVPLVMALVCAGAFALIAILAWGWPVWLAPLAAAVALAIGGGTEARRWREAGRARLLAVKPGTPQLPVAVARELPRAAPPQLAPIVAAPPAPVAPTATEAGPRFLKRPDDPA